MKTGIVSDENWIAALPPRIRDAVWARCTTIHVAIGQQFSHAGDSPDGMFQVATGFLRLTAFQVPSLIATRLRLAELWL